MTDPDGQQDGGAPRVVGLGLAVLDELLLWRDASEPVAGNRVEACDLQGGGMVATALSAVTRLGGRAEFWGIVGDDWSAEIILAGLRAERIDTTFVRRVPGPGPRVIVSVDGRTGERHFVHFTGRLACDEPVGDLARLAGASCLLVDHTRTESELQAADEARRRGVPVVGDMGGFDEDARPIFARLDYAICNEHVANQFGGVNDLSGSLRRIRDLGCGHIVVTLGPRGLAYLDGETLRTLDAFDVAAVDTTGAGDTFHGAFCYGLGRGLSFERNLLFSSAVAALKCRQLGGRAGQPTLDEALAFLADRGHDVSA